MGIRLNANARNVIERAVKEAERRVGLSIIRELTILGEECVNRARSIQTYQDQTGNLRASIGYIVVANGGIVQTNFIGSAIGQQAGLSHANSFHGVYGYYLIVVAGMDYAMNVESHGYDVLSTTEHFAESEIKKVAKRIVDSVMKLA